MSYLPVMRRTPQKMGVSSERRIPFRKRRSVLIHKLSVARLAHIGCQNTV